MYSIWTKHCKDDTEKEKVQKSIQGSKKTLDILHKILVEMESDLDRAEINPRTYEIPNWDYRQAHNNGYRQCLTTIMKLVNLDQQRENNG